MANEDHDKHEQEALTVIPRRDVRRFDDLPPTAVRATLPRHKETK